MSTKNRYIAKILFSFTFTVLVIWLGVYSFFNFLEELDSIGRANYTSFEAMKYIALNIPQVIYSHSTSIILLGCILGMGQLASNNELIVMRVSGTSILKITFFTVKVALLFVFTCILLGETIVPVTSEFAERSRANALGMASISKNEDGFWIKDGQNFINVKKNLEGQLFLDISIYELNSLNTIGTFTSANKAVFDGQSLEIQDAEVYSLDESKNINNISFEKFDILNKLVSFDTDFIDSIKKSPEDLTTSMIIKQISYLSDNKLRSDIFELELYKRLIKPFTLIAMIIIGMLFVFESNRSVTLGRKIFIGITLALSFEMISRVGSAFSLGFNVNPLVIVTMPTLIVLIIAFLILVSKSVR
jgi:lipopolysaccharide export system permease protein